jgi:predicted ATPase
LAWSPDGTHLGIPCRVVHNVASARSVLVWHESSGSFHDYPIAMPAAAVVWSPANDLFAVGGDNERIEVFDIASGSLVQSMRESSGWLISLAWHPSESIIASGSWNGTVQLWDARSGEVIRWFSAHSQGINALAWSNDGSLLASGSADGTVRISRSDGESVAAMKAHQSAVHALAWSHSGGIFASGSKGGNVRLWDGRMFGGLNLLHGHSRAISSIGFSADDQLLVTKSLDGSVRFWRSDEWKTVARISEGGDPEWRAGLACHPTAPVIATHGDGALEVRIWDVDAALLRSSVHFGARERALRERLRTSPTDVKTIRELVDVLRQTGQSEEAVHTFDLLLDLEPDNTDLILEKAAIYRDVGDERRYLETVQFAEQLRAKHSFQANVGADIRVVEVEVKDLPFFGSFVWPLQTSVNVLLGRNGYGKTHLLRAIVAMLQTEKDVTAQFFPVSSQRSTRPGIRVDVTRGGRRESALRSRMLFDREFGKVPVLAIPDMRYVDKAADALGPPSSATDLRSQGADALLYERSFQGLILTFLYELCLDYDRARTFDQPIFRIIEQVFARLTSDGRTDGDQGAFKFHSIERLDNARFRILVITDGNTLTPLPLQKASQGTLSVLSIVGLIYRFLRALHPGIDEGAVTSQPAIVVIDEVDAHLHPTWQAQILQLLRETFPNVQFIVTAHTPLVVAGCKRLEVSALRKTSEGFTIEVRDEHFIGATAVDLYSRLFDVEDKDLMFLQLSTLQGKKRGYTEEIAQLQARKEVSSAELVRLGWLEDQLYYLEEVSRIAGQRDEAANLRRQHQRLEMDNESLHGRIAELEAEVARLKRESPLSDAGSSDQLDVAEDAR